MPSRPAAVDRRARYATAALFLTNGALFANLVPRYPEIKDRLGMGDAVYGVALAAFPTGAIAAGLAAGVLIRRFGSGRVATTGTILTGAGVVLAGLAPHPVLLMAVLFLAGAMDALTDVAQNEHGLRVQRRYGRSIFNSFHATWSLGAVLGGLMAAAAITGGLAVPVHLVISGVLFAAVALIAYRYCLPPESGASRADPAQAVAEAEEALELGGTAADAVPGTEPPARPGGGRDGPGGRARRGHLTLVLAALVLIAVCGAVVEDSGNSWAALYLADSLQAPGSIAALGFTSLVAAQFVGRLLGDRLVDRFGQRAVARAGGVIIAVGMGLALAFPSVPGTIAGFAAAGLGSATLVPAAMHEADTLPGLRRGTGLTVVSWLMRIGFLATPPLVGLISEATSLRWALLVVPLAGLVVIALARVLSGRGETR